MSSQQDKVSGSQYEPVQFSIASLLRLTAGAAFCLSILLGLHGPILLALDAGFILLAILTKMGVRRVAGFTIPMLTFVEWLSIVIALLFLHLSLAPTVTSG